MDQTLNDPIVGQVIDGRYRVDARIAVGGMATVYRALDMRLDRVLALKVMHPALATDAGFVERFIREAKSVARLSHPNVVAVFDQGAQGAYVYLAMEYVSGCTLRDVLRERGALQPRAALDILEPVLAALGAAHRAGFVHRDMKPENVLIGDDGRVKVADFGLVRTVGDATATTGSVLGTVSYLAPEQIADGASAPGVDVYACGVVLYEMLTGAKPHQGENAAQVLYRHLGEDVPVPSAAVPGLPVELDDLVAAATARRPEVRPPDAVALLALTREARAALTDAQLDAEPPHARPSGPASGSENRTRVIPRASVADPGNVLRTSRLEVPPGPPGGGAPVRHGGGRRRWGVLVALAAAVVVVVGAGVWYIGEGQFTQVPSLLGQTESAARQRLSDAGFEVKVTKGFSDAFDRGTVMASDPAPRSRIRGEGPVTIEISRGPRTVAVPRLAGVPLTRARGALREAGLAPGVVTQRFDDGVAKGAVVSTEPDAGATLRPGSAVRLVVSRGSAVDVPDVTGESAAQATADLKAAGLAATVSPEQVESPAAKGSVAEQSPPGGQLGRGDSVTLTLSKGPRMVAVPDVTGEPVAQAKAELAAKGFDVTVKRGFPFLGDTVTGQSVTGGDQAPQGSTITLMTSGL